MKNVPIEDLLRHMTERLEPIIFWQTYKEPAVDRQQISKDHKPHCMLLKSGLMLEKKLYILASSSTELSIILKLYISFEQIWFLVIRSLVLFNAKLKSTHTNFKKHMDSLIRS